jgi:antitoxin component YwqK of YwqJK toxin-antitoxin module
MILKLTKTILLLLITVNLLGQDTIYFDSKWNECQSENAEFFRVDIKTETGFQRTDYFFENNQVQMAGSYISINPEIKTGIFKKYHKIGQLRHTGEYRENKEIGTHQWLYSNGNTEAIENYSNGKLDGVYKEFHENGKPMSETNFSNGIQSGLTKYYRENGSLHSEGQFKNGERNGTWKYYGEKGELLGTNEFKTEYIIEEAQMFIKLPNTEWTLTEKIEGGLTQYYFNRTAIIDKNGLEISPAIMLFVEDASKYEGDVTLYSVWKRKSFMEKGIKIEETLIHENEDYPLSYKNAYFMKCSYTSNDLDHIFYMIHIITKENKGIQLYLDMTKDIAPDYESEFWKTIKSLREI